MSLEKKVLIEKKSEDQSEEKSSTTKVVLLAIFGNGAIAVAKFFAWIVTQSPSMLAEAIHSLADTFNQFLLFVGVQSSSSGPTQKYPWGKGMSRYLWNLISAVGIFFIGFGVTAYHGIHSLLHPAEASEWSWIPPVVLAFAFIIELYVFVVAYKEANRSRDGDSWFDFTKNCDDPTLIAVLFEDGVAVIGLVLAFAGIFLSHYFNSSIPDSIAAILIALLLGVLGVGLAYINSQFLMGRSLLPAEEKEISKFLEGQPSVEKVVCLKTTILGTGLVRLSAEIEFHGSAIIDRKMLSKDAEKIRSGKDDPLPLLVDASERAVRSLGNQINQLEKICYTKFENLASIEFEVN